ncbi:MAG: hypothetical protein AB1665_03440 [Candidatus Thermoplasmatota archaeon]
MIAMGRWTLTLALLIISLVSTLVLLGVLCSLPEREWGYHMEASMLYQELDLDTLSGYLEDMGITVSREWDPAFESVYLNFTVPSKIWSNITYSSRVWIWNRETDTIDGIVSIHPLSATGDFIVREDLNQLLDEIFPSLQATVHYIEKVIYDALGLLPFDVSYEIYDTNGSNDPSLVICPVALFLLLVSLLSAIFLIVRERSRQAKLSEENDPSREDVD